jgi:hypothetical protein
MARYDDVLAQELNVLIEEATPYSLSSPSFGSPTIHDFVKGLILATNIIKVFINGSKFPACYGRK